LTEKEEFESQLADKEAAEEELQKQKEEAENEVFRRIFCYKTNFHISFIVYKYNNKPRPVRARILRAAINFSF